MRTSVLMKNVWFQNGLLFAGCLFIALVTNGDKFLSLTIKTIIHVAFQTMLIFGLLCLLNNQRFIKWGVAVFLGVIFFVHFAYQAPLSMGVIFSVLSAPLNESTSFLVRHGWELAVALLVVLAVGKRVTIPKSVIWKPSLLLGVGYLIIPFALQLPKAYSNDEFADYINKGTARGYSNAYSSVEYTFHKLSLRFPAIQSVIAIADTYHLMNIQSDQTMMWSEIERKPNAPDLLVIGIGESLRAGNMSLYGYERETTPYLDKMRDKLTVFRYPYAAGSNTWGSVPAMLTKTEGIPNMSQSVILLANAADYETYWLSNHAQFGQWDFSISTLAQQTDHQYFSSQADGGTMHDEILVEQLAKVLAEPSKKKVIFLHFYGSHMNFSDRYPKTFETFRSNNRRLDEYDNSVVYSDYLQAQVLELVEEAGGQYAFFSDHGLGSPNGPLSLRHDVRTPPDIESLYVPFFFTGDVERDYPSDQPFSMFYFECFFSDWAGIKASELSEQYCSESLNQDSVTYLDANMALDSHAKSALRKKVLVTQY